MSISSKSLSIEEAQEVRPPYDRPKLLTRVGPSRTHQSFRDETRIQSVYERFTRTGVMPHEDRRASARYEDVSHLNRDLTELVAESSQTISTFREDLRNERKRRKAAQQLPPEGGSTSPASPTPPVASATPEP